MSLNSHLTVRYVVDRLKMIAYEKLYSDAPWLTADMVAFLDKWLCSSDCGLEWGSGRSTVWLAHRISRLFTIEESPEWGQRVNTLLCKHGVRDRVDLNIVRIGPGQTESVASAYVSAALALPAESLDFCLIDGSLREYCTLVALPLLRPGGLLVIDNVERYLPREQKSRAPNARGIEDGCPSEGWAEVWGTIASWRSIWTTNGVSDTALWVKPAGVAR